VALRPRLSPGVPLSWDVPGQRDATVRYTSRQENLGATASVSYCGGSAPEIAIQFVNRLRVPR
jgi:hypothetical protein